MSFPLRVRVFGDRTLARIASFFWRRISFLTKSGELRRLDDGPGAPVNSRPWVVVIDRELYSETIEYLPPLKYSEAAQILRLKHADSRGGISFLIGPSDSGGRTARIFRLASSVPDLAAQAFFLIPESALFSKGASVSGVTEVHRDGKRYFLAVDKPSQWAGGLVSTASLYGLSVGVREPEVVDVIDDGEFAMRLVQAVPKLRLMEWLGFLNAPFFRQVLLALKRPMLVGSVLALAYLALVSSWLWWAEHNRGLSADEVAPVVEKLVVKQREIDRSAAEYSAIGARLQQGRSGLVIWWLAAEVWKQNGAVATVSMSNGEAVLQGTARSAATLLSLLSEHPSVEGVRVNGPVTRISDEAEQFSITVKIRNDAFLNGDARAP